MNMRLIGARTIEEIVPSMVDTSSLKMHTTNVPEDRLYRGNCELYSLSAAPSAFLTLGRRGDALSRNARQRQSQAVDAGNDEHRVGHIIQHVYMYYNNRMRMRQNDDE